MFENIGKNAVDGAIQRIGERLHDLDPNKLNIGLAKLAENIPVLGIFVKGFEAMTPEEQATFTKNLMLAGAAMAAKSGGKVSF